MCDKSNPEIEKTSNEENQRHEDYSTESTSLISKNESSGELRSYEHDVSQTWPNNPSIRYPRANVYYAYTEDINPFDRVEDFIENERKQADENVQQAHFDPPLDPFTIRDPYEENAARAKYLRTEPVSFAIFGKPGSESAGLAKLISEWWKCILLSPETLVNQEIDKNTDKGRWIVESLNRGEKLEPRVIANLINDRIKERDLMHRGYVIEGLPIIPQSSEVQHSTCPDNDGFEKATDPCCKTGPCMVESETTNSSTESTVSGDSFSYALQRRANLDMATQLHLLQRANIQEDLREAQVVSSYQVDPFLNARNDEKARQSYKDYVPSQVDMIFQSWPLKPTIIVYITCPDDDATLRHRYLHPDSSLGRTRGSARFHEPESPIDRHRSVASLIDRSDQTADEKFQLEVYQRYALPAIDRHVLRHNPQNVIRVEGRRTASQMFEVVSSKLRSLPFSRAVIPKKIFQYGDSDADGDEDFDFGNFGNSDSPISERLLDELSRKSTISSKFRWTLSNWKLKCPVEATKGYVVDGKLKFAVRFMNKMFFLSSIDTMNLFLENPRPFLVSMKPKPICRIAIFGPPYSGKSELGEALARKFQVEVIDVQELMKTFIDERMNADVTKAIEEARDRIVEDVTAKLENDRQRRETARTIALESWITEAEDILRRLDQLQRVQVAQGEQDVSHILDELRAIGLEEFESNQQLLEIVMDNLTMLYDYAPPHLREEEPPVPQVSEDDPEILTALDYESKHLREHKIFMTNDEIARLLTSRIKMITADPIDDESTRTSGYILIDMNPDPEIWKILAEADVHFNDVILITEESPYEKLLRSWERYYDARNSSGEYDEDYIDDSKIEAMEDYIAEIKDFEDKWQLFNPILDSEKTLICKFDESSNHYDTVSKLISGPYQPEAKIISAVDKESEFESTIESVTDIDEETDEDSTQNLKLNRSKGKTIDRDNRLFGDTGIYCPVALARNNILWKGKEEYSAVFLDKIYLFSSELTLEEFVKSPETFNVPFQKPAKFPLARICIVGPTGSGKSTLAGILARENGITHVDFSNILREYLKQRGILGDLENEDLTDRGSLASVLIPKRSNDDEAAILAFARTYKNKGGNLPVQIFNDCFLRFFKTPYDNSAIIFDGFPNCLEDAEIMVNNYALPELVIELECCLETAQKRLLPEFLESLMKKREIGKNTEGREKEREIIENAEDDEEKEDEEEEKEEIEREEEEEMEDGEEDTIDEGETTDRILRKIEEAYSRNNQMLDEAREVMDQESIPWIRINTDRDLDNSLLQLRKIVRPFFRKASPFERTQELDVYKAEELLDCGYFLLSSFGRSCPVQIYERRNPFQMYLPMDEKDDVHPILHRHYIYFVAGAEATEKFCKDPLKYLSHDSCDPVIPARLSILGPPKSGKSSLAERFARAYGMRVINRENALRWTRNNYSWTKNAIEIEKVLGSDRQIPKNLFARSVELYCSDYRSATQGYILDGFPADREEAEEMALFNIRPMVVLSLQADRNFCLSTASEPNGKDIDQETSNRISHRYDEWREVSSSFFDWLTKYTQNIVNIDATRSKWYVWREADIQVRSRFADLKRYFREADYDKVHSLKNLLVTPYEFKNRQSPYQSYCPACLHYEDSMTFSGSPPDRRGVLQFREYFYWTCPKHRREFMKNPLACLPPQTTAKLPTVLPRVLNDEIDVEHACWARRLVADGNCVVTYADALPECVLTPGKKNIGALYEDRLYLFCSIQCREKFISRAHFYSTVVIEMTTVATALEIKKLTNLEYLENTMADAIINSLSAVAAKRPKYPGMSIAVSAAVFIAINLKINNLNCSPNEIPIYEEVLRRLEARTRIIKIAMRNMKKIKNPYP